MPTKRPASQTNADTTTKVETATPAAEATLPAAPPEQHRAENAGPRRRRRQRPERLQPQAPRVAQSRGGISAPTTKVRPEPPFWLGFTGVSWTVHGGHVVPNFIRISAEPGANGVGMKQKRDGTRLPLVEHAKAMQRERGVIVLEWDVMGPGTSYIQKDPRTGGWFDIWTSIYAATDRKTFDDKAYAAWYHRLVDMDILPLPPLHALEALYDNLSDMLEKVGPENHNRAEIAAQLEVVQRELAEAQEEEAEKLGAPLGQVAPADPNDEVG